MDISNRKGKALDVVREQLAQLREIATDALESREIKLGFERLNRWKHRTVDELGSHVHANEAKRLDNITILYMGEPSQRFMREVTAFEAYLVALQEEIVKNPERVLDAPVAAELPPRAPAPLPNSNVVFIIHGHDELNLLRLRNLIRDRWKLESIVLAKEAGKGRTVIEKFEEEAKRASFALALLTPDDIITVEDKEDYAQARPNVIFELGWFYAKLGRRNVSILCKTGNKIHSDLEGISRIEFNNRIDDVASQIEDELVAAGVIKR